MIDRFYFKSIYFREPSGVLFEIATLGPGFTADEPLETLGEKLSLPPEFEQLRAQVEPMLDAAAEPAPRALAVIVRERPAAGEAEGALVLFHGRGADENDLFPLLDVLDPERRLDGYTPRGAALAAARRRALVRRPARRLSRSGDVRARRTRAAGEWLDSLPHERIVLGGFSQGA